MSALSPRTEQLIERAFTPAARAAVRALLERDLSSESLGCTGWSVEEMERIWFAALKLGEGDLPAFETAVSVGKTDWRDLLVAAGFGEDLDAHRRWWASVC
jgi:hypothetical protein